jgi:hypothetical protein
MERWAPRFSSRKEIAELIDVYGYNMAGFSMHFLCRGNIEDERDG